MKRTWICCVIALLFVGSIAWSEAQTTGGTEKAVAALEQQWLQSQKTNNTDLLVPLLADKFSGTGPDGKLSEKTQTLAEAKATKYDSIEYEDVKVVVFGDAAIATGGGRDPRAPMHRESPWTNTCVGRIPGSRCRTASGNAWRAAYRQ